MYRLTKRAAQRREPGSAATLGAAPLPTLRRTVIIIDRDFGLRVTRLDLWRTRRVDTYRVTVDGREWRQMGWSALLAAVRRAMPRVGSPRSLP